MSYDQGRMDAYQRVTDWLLTEHRKHKRRSAGWFGLWSPLMFMLAREKMELRRAGTVSGSECVGAVRLLGDLWKEEA